MRTVERGGMMGGETEGPMGFPSVDCALVTSKV